MDYDDPSLYERTIALVKRVLLASSVTERTIFILITIVALISGLGLVTMAANKLLVTVPSRGGSLVEGIVGTPRFANPVLAASEADRDLDALVFSGLTRQGKDGIESDLATYTVSEDGREYHFTIKYGAKFHDGTPVSTDDILFTIEKTQDPEVRSPRRSTWAGIETEKVDDREIIFRLKESYPGFLSATTMGILPKSHFENLSAQDFLYAPENVEPIGSGPFRVTKVMRVDDATIGYELKPWTDSVGVVPHLSSLTLRFYPDEKSLVEALRQGDVVSAYGLSPASAESLARENFRVERQPLPRLYAVFFNQSHDPVLADRDVRLSLNLAVNREKIIKEVLAGYGSPINGPIPPALPLSTATVEAESPAQKVFTGDIDSARATLKEDGFISGDDGILARKTKKGSERLAISIATADAVELVSAANLVAEAWREVGASVDVKVFPVTDLADSVIRKREYDALLFGEVVGRGADFYSFWHSSQRTDPGLNVASYTNSHVDDLLTKARTEPDQTKRDELLESFAIEVKKDIPAVFLYAPEATYVLPEKISAPLPELISTPSERFTLIRDWYENTERVWPIFADQR